MQQLATGLGGAIGSRYLKNRNRLVFTEYSGAISKIDLTPSMATIVSQGTVLLKGTWLLDCETGTQSGLTNTADIWWEQINTVKRQMVPRGNAQIVNLGVIDYNLVTPSTIQSYPYSGNPIIGNADSSNKLVDGTVFCVKTREGNYCKLKVLSYGYNINLQWTTYKFDPAYTKLGTGYNQPEDVAVTADETTAYVTERTGNLLRVNLSSANRASAVVVASGMTAPHQLWLEETHQQAYVVEYANPGKLYRINLLTGTKTALYSGLNMALGLVLSADLNYAFVSEQGTSAVSRINLATGTKTAVASGLQNPFFMAWSDETRTKILVAERDPANRIAMIDISAATPTVQYVITGTAIRPSSVSVIGNGDYAVFSDAEVARYNVLSSVATGLYKGIGYVPWNLITALGKADTTTQPAYPFQFAKDAPFGGTLPVLIDHDAAWTAGARYYRVIVDGLPRKDTWNDLRLNPVNGRYEIIEAMTPNASGFYNVHNPVNRYYNADLGCLLPSTTLANGLHASFTVEFYNASFAVVSTRTHRIFIDNNKCVATMDMPLLDGVSALAACGYVKYTDKTRPVSLGFTASHPQGFSTYSYGITKGATSHYGEGGPVVPNPLVKNHVETVAALLGTCPTVAAFYESLYVATTVINGVGRQSQYDASAGIAFCLAP
jgi:hypothetical protein